MTYLTECGANKCLYWNNYKCKRHVIKLSGNAICMDFIEKPKRKENSKKGEGD